MHPLTSATLHAGPESDRRNRQNHVAGGGGRSAAAPTEAVAGTDSRHALLQASSVVSWPGMKPKQFPGLLDPAADTVALGGHRG